MLALALCLALLPQGGVPNSSDSAPAHQQLIALDHAISAFAIDAKRKRLFVATQDMKLRSIDVESGDVVWTADKVLSHEFGASISCGKKFIATLLPSTTAYTSYDVKTGVRGEAQAGITVMQKGTSLVVDPRDRWVWIGTNRGVMTRLTPGNIKAWSNRGMKNEGVTSIALDPKAKLLAVGGADGTIRFLDSKSAQRDLDMVLEGHDGAVRNVTWSTKGKLVIASSGKNVLVHSLKTKKLKFSFSGHEQPVCAIVASPTGKWIASADALGTVIVWNTKDGEEWLRFEVPDVTGGWVALAATKKGKRLVTAAGSKVLTWDVSEVGK